MDGPILLELTGNLSTLTTRSFGVTDRVIQGRFEIGLTIDFLAQSKSEILDFRYGTPVMIIAASIGLLKNGRSPKSACKFFEMALSKNGQQLLLQPHIARVPISWNVRVEYGKTPKAIENALKLQWISYDARLSAQRYWAINSLFDVIVTEVLDQRKTIWARLDSQAEDIDPSEFQKIKETLPLPITPEIEVAKLSSFMASNLRTTRLMGSNKEEAKILETWHSLVRKQLRSVEQALLKLDSKP